MKKSTLLKRTAIAAVVATTLSQCSKSDTTTATQDDTKEPVLVISSIPDSKTTNLSEKFQPLVDHLAKELDVKVEFQNSVEYTDSVEKFKTGDFTLVWYGGLTGVRARAAVEGANAIAQGIEDPNYKSYFIANASTGLEKSDEFPLAIKDLTFTFGSNSSTSGFMMPSHFIKENSGKMPDDFFTKPVAFSGAHDKTALQVAQGNFQAGAMNYGTYDSMVAEGKIDPEVCRIIWVTPPYADYNFTAHPKLNEQFGEGFVEKLQAAILSASEEVAKSAVNRSGFVKAENSDYKGIEDVARALGELR